VQTAKFTFRLRQERRQVYQEDEPHVLISMLRGLSYAQRALKAQHVVTSQRLSMLVHVESMSRKLLQRKVTMSSLTAEPY